MYLSRSCIRSVGRMNFNYNQSLLEVIQTKGENSMESTTLVAHDISHEHCQHPIEGQLGNLRV
jgi:hypothetical protein